MKPLGTLILVKPFDKEMERDGITLTATGVHQPEKGTIKEIGDAINTVAVGDDIIFRKDAFTKIVIDGVDHLLMDIKSCYAIM